MICNGKLIKEDTKYACELCDTDEDGNVINWRGGIPKSDRHMQSVEKRRERPKPKKVKAEEPKPEEPEPKPKKSDEPK